MLKPDLTTNLSINSSTLDFNLPSESIFCETVHDTVLDVRQQHHYRWLSMTPIDAPKSSGSAVQGVIDLHHPHQLYLPYCQAMLLFLLWKPSVTSVLNLGMGTGSFERAFKAVPYVSCTSVEANATVVALGKRYFAIADNTPVEITAAQQYLAQTGPQFDVILCDLFTDKHPSECIYQGSFYQNLAKTLAPQGCVVMNIMVENEAQLIEILTSLRTYFASVMLVDFADYRNIVVFASQDLLPTRAALRSALPFNNKVLAIDFEPFISRLITL